jgi:RNA polymerase I-specific transcription initiation factor RRN5
MSTKKKRNVVNDSETPVDKARKRTRYIPQVERHLNSQLADLTLAHLNAYVEVLNQDIDDARLGVRYDDEDDAKIRGGYVGASYWSSKDKLKFFNALAVYPQHDLPNIAAAVGKSLPEVRAYILLLEDATAEYKAAVGPNRGALDMTKVPAAIEIPSDLRRRLARAAETMEEKRIGVEENADQFKLGKYHILDQTVAEEVAHAYRDQEEERNEAAELPQILKDIPSANILHLPNFLELADVLFQTPRNREWTNRGWLRTLIARDDPAIRLVAFEDFETLVTSLTKRILSAVFFQANTRIRSYSRLEGWGGSSKRYIRVLKDDVFAALEVLGLKRNAFDYWKGAPKRLEFSCTTSSLRYRGKSEIDHYLSLPYEYTLTQEQTELALSAPFAPMHDYSSTVKNLREEYRAKWVEIGKAIAELEESESDYDEDDDDDDNVDEDKNRTSNKENNEAESDTSTQGTDSDESIDESDGEEFDDELMKDVAVEQEEEEILTAYDQRKDKAEIERLWNMVGKSLLGTLGEKKKATSEARRSWQIVPEPGPNATMPNGPVSSESEDTNLPSDDSDDRTESEGELEFQDADQSTQWKEVINYRGAWEQAVIQGESHTR